MALEHGDPLRAALPLGPQIERLASETCRVPVGVNGRQLVDRPHQRVERTGSVASRDPVRGHLGLTGVARLECLREIAVERTPA